MIALSAPFCVAHDGQPEHQPKHGGIVFSSSDLDAELVPAKQTGRYQLFFTDGSGDELPAAITQDVSLSIKRPNGSTERVPMRIDDSGESWIGAGSFEGIKQAWISYRFRGRATQTEVPFGSVFHASMQTVPQAVKAGTPVQLAFMVKDFFEKPVRTLQIVHEKPMHLMIVSNDLSEFYHIHPEPGAGGVFRVSHVFAHGGAYKLFTDFTPVGGPNRIEPFDLKVQGAVPPPAPLDASGAMVSSTGGVKVSVTADRPLRTGQDLGLTMTMTDAKTGAPIHSLQRYLGAWAHIAVVSQDSQDFIHVHPIEEGPQSGASPDRIRTATGFRKAGLYKMWVQVQRANQVIAVPFVLRIADAGAGVGAPITRRTPLPPGAILVKVSGSGFEPARIPAKAGQSLKLAFYRPDAQNCGREVIFPALGIQRPLPPGETVIVDVTPKKSGALGFSCGMKMFKGELIVQ
jgi:hypothetical protein